MILKLNRVPIALSLLMILTWVRDLQALESTFPPSQLVTEDELFAKLPQDEAKEQAEKIQRELLEDRKQDEADDKKIKKFMKEELSFPEDESAAGMEKVPSDDQNDDESTKSE